MSGLGGLLIMFAIGSAILPMFGRQFTLFMWIDNWGPTVGWVIRGVMLLVGIALAVGGSMGRTSAGSGGKSS